MLTAVPWDSRQQVLARTVVKDAGPFTCPECGGEVILRKGRIKVHHFAHKPPVDCAYGTGETELHRQAKQDIYDALLESGLCTDVALEASIGGIVRPDVQVRIKNVHVAIEVQGSSLTVAEIARRTRGYYNLGVCVFWVQPHTPTEDSKRAAPRAWERMHYWTEGAELLPVHFSEYQIWVEETEWYEEDAILRQEGGYYRYSKRWRTADHGMPCTILDCRPVVRQSWNEVPVARIWQSVQPNWW